MLSFPVKNPTTQLLRYLEVHNKRPQKYRGQGATNSTLILSGSSK